MEHKKPEAMFPNNSDKVYSTSAGPDFVVIPALYADRPKDLKVTYVHSRQLCISSASKIT